MKKNILLTVGVYAGEGDYCYRITTKYTKFFFHLFKFI